MEKEFVWTDELVKKYSAIRAIEHNTDIFVKHFTTMEEFKENYRKNFLLTTEDGVNIYKGGYWYVVILKDGIPHKRYDIVGTSSLVPKNIQHLNFSTKAIAEAYVKENKVLFTSMDGVEMRYNDNYWLAYDDNYHIEALRWKAETIGYLCSGIKDFKSINHTKGIYRFSSFKAAEEWVELNKPQFSLNDIKKGLSFYSCDSVVEVHIKKIQELAKKQ